MKKVYLFGLGLLVLNACQNPTNSEGSDQGSEQAETKQEVSLSLAWESEASLPTNESVLYNPNSESLFVSCINGKPTDIDTNGYIAVLDLEGNIVDRVWAGGFNAPKGMAISQGRLFFSDINRIVSVNLANPADRYYVEVPGSRFLNDLTPGLNGVYFSDMATGHLYYLEAQVVHTINEDLPNLNGLAFHNDFLYALSKNGLQKLSVGGEVLETINADLSGGDGLIVLDEQRFIMSRWQGEVWYVENGQAKQLLDSKEEEIQTADIGFNPNTKTLYVPRFFANKVSAYKVNGI